MSVSAKRYTMFPVVHATAFDFYKKAVATFWTADEIDFSSDARDFSLLNKDEQHFLQTILAFFAASDGIVNENLALSFYEYFDMAEIRAVYSMQLAIETIHSETYSLLIETLIPEPSTKARLFNAIETSSVITEKANWALQWIDNKGASHAQKLIAYIIVEGLFFAGSFAAIFFFRQRGIMPGLCFSNDLISRDESLHYQFGVYLYNEFFSATERLPTEQVHAMFKEALRIETYFMTEALKVDLIGLSSDRMVSYLEYIANRLLVSLNYEPLNGGLTENPLSFMATISLDSKVNFFERKNSQYNKIVVNQQEDIQLDFSGC